MIQTEAFLVTFLSFLGVAVLVSFVARRLRIPYTVAMVLAGLLVSVLDLELNLFEAVGLEPELILLVFLPGLLFEASFHLDLRQLRANLRSILLLAIPGVLLSTGSGGNRVALGTGASLDRSASVWGAHIGDRSHCGGCTL